MTTDRYHADRITDAAESTRHFDLQKVPGYGLYRSIPVNEPGFYKYAIREVGREGWVFRFAHITPDIRTIVDALNNPVVELESAA